MAKVVYGGGVASFRGSIGGLTFQSNRSGAIVRRRPVGNKSISNKQSNEISNFFRFKLLWQNLSQANVDLWNTFADTYPKTDMWGTAKTLSGINWFCTINYYRVLISQSVLSAPPAHVSPLSIPTFNFILTSSHITLGFDTPWGTVAHCLLCYTTYPIPNKTNNFRPALRLTKVINTGAFKSIDLTADWETAHGLTYPPGGTGSDFYIGIALRTAKISACVMGPASFDNTQFENVPNGIGSMIIGETFIIG